MLYLVIYIGVSFVIFCFVIFLLIMMGSEVVLNLSQQG